jgi:hypothetical protein
MPNDAFNPELIVVLAIRRFLMFLLAVGMLGTAADLLLLEHYENGWQIAPLVLIGLGLLALAWVVTSGGRFPVLMLRAIMVGFITAGALGFLLHYNGNSEFQREIDPSLSGWDLVKRVMTAKAPPALAPASMIQLGFLGLLYTYRHPALRSARSPSPPQRSTR